MSTLILRTLKRIQRGLARRDGATSLEFALVALFFFGLSLGAVEVGRAMWVRNSVQFAAEEAARWAVVRPTATAGQVQTFLTGCLAAVGQAGAAGTVAFQTTGGRRFVLVTATSPFRTVTRVVPVGPVTLLGQARMPVS